MPLVIVQRGKFAAFDRLTRALAGDPTVRVIWDRRLRDRRQTAAAVAADRRRIDRRSARAWTHDQYVVIHAADVTA